jgi:hypothetical protein
LGRLLTILVTVLTPGPGYGGWPHGKTARLEYVEGDGRGEVLVNGQWYDSAAPRFDHPAACAARTVSMKPALGGPRIPCFGAGHQVRDDKSGIRPWSFALPHKT